MKKQFDSIVKRVPQFLTDDARIVAYNLVHNKKAKLGLGATLIIALLCFLSFTLVQTATVKPVRADGNVLAPQKSDFLAQETPQFLVNSGGLVKEKRSLSRKKEFIAQTGKLAVGVKNLNVIGTSKLPPNVDIQSNTTGETGFLIKVPTDGKFKPGKYQLSIDVIGETKTQHLTQDFTWGVLAINLDQSSYRPGETAKIGMGILDDHGITLCDAKATLEITKPNGQLQVLSTENGRIVISKTCANANITYNPDYLANYRVEKVGKYQLKLTAQTKNGTRTINDSFEAIKNPSFVITRSTATRIYPASPYTVNTTLKANEDFSGKVVETVPAAFVINQVSDNGKLVSSPKEGRKIEWAVQLKKGDSFEISYNYQAPPVSPEFYLLGPMVLIKAKNIIYQEPRPWQIASDATCTASVAGNWNAGGTWGGTCGSNSYPAASAGGDIVVINSGITVTLNVSPAYSIASLTTNAASVANGVTWSGTNSLTNAGTTTINAPTAAVSSTLAVAAGTYTAQGLITITGGGTSTYIANLSATTGTINIQAGVTLWANAQSRITTTGAANIYLTGTMTGGAGGCFVLNANSKLHAVGSATFSAFTTTSAPLANVILDSGSSFVLGTAINVAGSLTNNSGTSALSGNYVFQFTGTAAKTLGGSYDTTFYQLLLYTGVPLTANTNFSVTSTTTLNATGAAQSLTLGSAAVTANLNNVTHNQPSGSFTSAFNVNAGTLNMSGVYAFAGTNLTAARVAKLVVTTGTINLNSSTSMSCAGTVGVTKVIDASGGNGTINISGNITTPSGCSSNPGTTSTWKYIGSVAQTIPMGTINVGTYWGACTTQCYANLVALNTNASGATLGNNVSPGDVSGNLTVGDGSTSTALSNGGYSITGASGKTFTVTNAATFNMTGTSTYPTGFTTYTYGASSNVNYKQTTSPLTLTTATYGNLGMVAAGTATQNFPAAAITVAGNLLIGNGTNATTAVANGSYIIYVRGNWTIGSGSAFTHSNGTVNFNGAGGSTQTVASATTFYNLTATASAARTINFASGTTTTVAGTWTCTGAASQNITLGRDGGSGSNQWSINPTAWSVDYVAPANSNNLAGSVIGPVHYSDGGNNTNWFGAANNPPSTPTSLTQGKTTGANDIAESAWTNGNQPWFGFSVTDPDSSDTVKYRIQIDNTDSNFTHLVLDYTYGSLAARGTTFAYQVGQAGTYAVGSVAMTLSDSATGYWWRVYGIDNSAVQSVSPAYFGTQATVDLKVDATAPTGGTIYDGNDGAQHSYNDYVSGSLTQLSAYWTATAPTFNVSGAAAAPYQYAIGTTQGGTDIKTWTATGGSGTQTYINATGLVLQTNVKYYFAIKATDLAGNIENLYSSGQQVNPSLSFSLAASLITFDNLNNANNWTSANKTVSFTTSTNASGGYAVQARILQLLTTMVAPTNTIASWTGTWATPTTWAGTCANNSQCGFGYTSSDASVQGSDRYGSGTKYAAYSQTNPGDVVADRAGPINGTTGSVVGESFTLTNRLSVAPSQVASTYRTTLILICTANF